MLLTNHMSKYMISIRSRTRATLRLVHRGEWFRIVTGLFRRCVPSSLASLDDLSLLACYTTPNESSTLSSEYTFSQASTIDLKDIIDSSNNTSDSQINRLFHHFDESGHKCYFVKCDGKVLAYCWIFRHEYLLTYDSYENTNIRVLLPDHICIIGNIFVQPKARGQGLGTALLSHVIGQLRSSNSSLTFLSFINTNNEISRQLHRQLGFSVVGRFCYSASPLGRFLLVRFLSAKTKFYRLTQNCVVDLIGL
jgi:GNAT superfamily N-acetyltransferase